jgi:hypothetical protein
MRRLLDKCPGGRICRAHAWYLNTISRHRLEITQYIHKVSVLLAVGFGGLLATSNGFAPAITLPLRAWPVKSGPGGACGIVMPPSPFPANVPLVLLSADPRGCICDVFA